MTTGTIVYRSKIVKILNSIFVLLYTYKYLFNNRILLSSHIPSPHKFNNTALNSSGWNLKSIQELIFERNKTIGEYNKNVAEFHNIADEIKNLNKAKDLDMKLPDKSKNWDMKKIMEFHASFFDEDSGNTREEGIEQLNSYLEEEKKGYRRNIMNIKIKFKEIEKELNIKKEAEEKIKKAAEENKNLFLPIIPMYSPIVFRILLTIFSFCISLKFIDFNLDYFIVHLPLPEIAISTTIISIVLFVWEYYRLYSKVRRYYRIGKIIYMFLKKNIYSFYNKIYSFYKKF